MNKHGLKVAFGTDIFGSRQNFDNTVKEFSARLPWFSSLEILKQATSGNAELLKLTRPPQSLSGWTAWGY